MLFWHKDLWVCKRPPSLVTCDRKTTILQGQIWSTHESDVVGVADQHLWNTFNLNTHWSLAICRVVAQECQVRLVGKDLSHGMRRRAFLRDPSHQHVFHFTPKHWWQSTLKANRA